MYTMNNQPCMGRPTFIALNPDKPYHYLFAFSMSRCDGSCNTVKDPVGRMFVPNKMEDMNLKVLNMIKGINEPNVDTCKTYLM